jgi:RNA polymerase sigma-70 factor (ECF subfamily)
MKINSLVALAQKGEASAFAELYDLFAQKLFRHIIFKVNNRHIAEDLLQETFLKAWKNLSSLKLENLNFSAWLYRIASNCVIDFYRQTERKPKTVELNEVTQTPFLIAPRSTLELSEDQEGLLKTMELLNPRYRQILNLRFIDDKSAEETAIILNISKFTVYVIQHRALKKLRQLLSKT